MAWTKEQTKAYYQEYRSKNKEHLNKYNKNYYENHKHNWQIYKEKFKNYSKNYYKTHKKYFREYYLKKKYPHLVQI